MFVNKIGNIFCVRNKCCGQTGKHLNRQQCVLVHRGLNGAACFPFKDYFEQLYHNALNTRNNGNTAKILKVKLDFAHRSFYFLGALIFNSLPFS